MKEKQELIDRYLLGEMDENEKASFEQQLSEDAGLREETQLTRHIIVALQKKNEREALEAMKTVPEATIREWLPSPRPASSRVRTIYICISAAAAAAVIFFVLYIGFTPRYSTEQLLARYYQVQPYETYPVRGGYDLTPDEKTWLQQAETFFRQANYGDALTYYNLLLSQKPDWKTLPEEAVFYAAICRLEANDLPAAIELLEHIASDDQSDFHYEALWNLAFAYLKDGQRSKAALYMEQLVATDSDYSAKARELMNQLKTRKWF